MSTAANKTEATKNSIASAAAQTTTGLSATALPDRRPVAAVQRRLQADLAGTPQLQRAATLQRAIDGSPRQQSAPALLQKKENNTGLPDGLKAGVENLSGHSLDDVRVHYNSAKPAQLQAHAYAQGTDIHVAPGQEKHLPHEAWHVVQQKQGRVRPTMQLKGRVAVNDDAGLEREADVMGAELYQLARNESSVQLQKKPHANGCMSQVSQLKSLQNINNTFTTQQVFQRKAANGTAERMTFETSAPEQVDGVSELEQVIQRKLNFSYSGGVITKCIFTKRPGWTAAVRHAMPSATGYDRGHLIPWMAVRLEIEYDLTGKNLTEAYDYLKDKGHEPDAKSWAAVEKAVRAYGRAENSDLDNLEYEDSHDNRSNGAKLPSAAELWQCAHEANGYKWAPPYKFNGEIIKTKERAKAACLEVGVPDSSLWAEAEERFGDDSNCSLM